MNTDKNKDQNQGKESTAKTDATYNRDAEVLKNSATTSQSSGESLGKVGVGGIITNEDKSGALKSMKGDDTNKLNPKEPLSEGQTSDEKNV
ncbi:hypothetical protein ACFS7Z_15795 [Pontibacter toksunensis]|uniref:Uncharacterized protein n=1 Tax=Pontibacter toksunensis TaxID=1332631 RepID=A0ABW6BY25_9BACT